MGVAVLMMLFVWFCLNDFLSAGFCGLMCVCGLGTVVSMPSGLDMVMNLWLMWFDLV